MQNYTMNVLLCLNIILHTIDILQNFKLNILLIQHTLVEYSITVNSLNIYDYINLKDTKDSYSIV